MIFQEELPTTTEETLFYQEPVLESSELTVGKEKSNMEPKADTPYPQCWTLYFDGSKSQEESGKNDISCLVD
jgi:hypothetical protein